MTVAVTGMEQKLRRLCELSGYPLFEQVPVGPYLAPWIVVAFDRAGVGRNVRILIEIRCWSQEVIARMAPSMKRYQQRLRRLTGVDFVSTLVPGTDEAPAGLTSFGELKQFFRSLEPPSKNIPDEIQANQAKSWPVPTLEYEQELDNRLFPQTEPPALFCAMPFAPAFSTTFFDLIAPAARQCGYVVVRTDQEESLRHIDERIRDGIRNARLIVGDISGHNPNVMYEIGLAHSLGKPSLLLQNDTLEVPFDLRNIEVLRYDLAQAGSSLESLVARIESCQ